MQPVTTPDNPEPVWCEDCRHVIRRLDGRDLKAYRWLCGMARRNLKPNFVSRQLLIEEPYYRAAIVNDDGRCHSYERLESAHG